MICPNLAPAPNPERSAGFALIIVLWALVLISFITAHLVGNGRVELRIAGNLVANAATEAAADGAVYHAIFNLMDPQPERRWPLDGVPRDLAIGGVRVTVSIDDETARVNPNLASPALLQALFRVTGSDPETANRLMAAIGEWIGRPTVASTPQVTLSKYRGAGLDYAPPAEPLETIDELQRVIGMTPSTFAAIRPYVSLFSTAEPTWARADRVVLAAMEQTGLEHSPSAPASDSPIARIVVKAHGHKNASATRSTIVRIMPASAAYAVLSWKREAE